MSSLLQERVKCASLLKKIVKDARELVPLFKHGDYIGMSGFTGVGYPKVVPQALADHVEKNQLQGQLKFNLFVGASLGAEVEDRWAKLDMIDRRYPHQVGKNIQKGINEGRIRFSDQHLSMFPQNLAYGFYTREASNQKSPINYAIIEATEIKEDGTLILAASVGATPEILQKADKIIIEVNTALPSFDGIHDIYEVADPPHRKPFLIEKVQDRIGTPGLKIDMSKVIAVVESNRPDNTGGNTPEDETSKQIARNLTEFLMTEVDAKRLPKELLPLQSGIGNIANAVISGMVESPFQNLTVFTEVLQDCFLNLFEAGKLDFASATSVRLSNQGFDKFYADWENYKKKIVLRPQSISNAPELIRRLGVIAMNTPVEIDIYGHANSTMVNGSRMINGLGGSGDFLRNGKLSIMHTPSVRPSKNDPLGITCIVPMVTHVDHTEHDLDVFVTEYGYADMRGLCPRDRARLVIEKCAHPEYRPILLDYYETCLKKCLKAGSAHEPHDLSVVFKMYQNLHENGTMRINKWW
ncbi:hypothetical protein C9374_000576 [Naegleria lovaniensis]|uniref:Acetyl-CoA hydrolase n=1 Tax=Naegleria lovaniensis TaxID=51637 RepID=A0AA88GWN6_NAELO|nr:uncharacterized protein C9374_000576 [Naegleria lovaniensis]KAG2388412.1 hypothetical protein C9374_000576 [Naegleria lovaniensis]